MRLYILFALAIFMYYGAVIIFVIYQIGEMGQPVARIEIAGIFAKRICYRNMPVCVYEKVNMLMFKYLPCVLDLKLLLILEVENLRFVGGAAGRGKMPCDGKCLSRVQHAVHYAVGFVSKDFFDEFVFPLFATQPIAVAD